MEQPKRAKIQPPARPKRQVQVKLNTLEQKDLESYCRKHKVSVSEVLRRGFNILMERDKNEP